MGSASAFLFRAVQTAEPDQVMKRLLMLLQLWMRPVVPPLGRTRNQLGRPEGDVACSLPICRSSPCTIPTCYLCASRMASDRTTVWKHYTPSGDILSNSVYRVQQYSPARLGEICKIGYLRSRAACGIPTLSGAVAIERGMDVFCLLGMARFLRSCGVGSAYGMGIARNGPAPDDRLGTSVENGVCTELLPPYSTPLFPTMDRRNSRLTCRHEKT